MKKYDFKDAVVANPERKKLTIVAQTANEIVADINYAEHYEQGTVLNAEILNEFQDTIEQSEIKSFEAVATAGDAKTFAQTAQDTSYEAKQLAEEAKSIAGDAKRIADDADTKAASAVISADTAKTSAAGAVASANAAVTAASNANTKADSAVETATNAETIANSAVVTATNANTKSDNANSLASVANSKAESAVETATNADNKATEALKQVVQMQGTKVYSAEQLLTTFDVDKKVDVEQGIDNANRVLVTDVNGDVTPSDEIFVNTINVDSKIKLADNVEINKDNCVTKENILDLIYPVGYIYASSENKSLADSVGGTWVNFAEGRTLVGVDTSDSNFNAVLKTGGEKTHTLSVSEMPQHNHTYNKKKAGYAGLATVGAGSTSSVASTSDSSDTYYTGNTGGGAAHNNLQPYVTVYYWKRVG